MKRNTGYFNSVSAEHAAYFFKYVLGFLFCFSIFSCNSGGTLKGSGGEQVSQSPIVVPMPTVISPLEQPYYSNDSDVTISGQCMSGHTVRLTSVLGFTLDSILCIANFYSFDLSQNSDGIYTYYVSQIDGSGAISLATNFTWYRKTSIAIPVVTYPPHSPFLSSGATLNITGSCENLTEIKLSGDGIAETECSNSQFSITLPKSVDGDYNLTITQTDAAGNSASKSFIWSKHALTTTPSTPVLQVATSQTFVISGGSGAYSADLTQNLSGGSYDDVNHIYTAGTLANVIDKLTITDSLGDSQVISIHTVAGDADHFSYAAVDGNNQNPYVGSDLTLPLKALVVDRFENPISSYPVFTKVLFGDAHVTSDLVQLTNLSGEISVATTAGHNLQKNRLRLSPVSSTLPDLAGTGRSQIDFEFINTTTNKGAFGSKFNIGQNANVVRLTDVNSDGKQDAIVLNAGDPSIGILTGLGNGLFSNIIKINGICASPNDLVAKDFNSDGKIDLAITCGNSLTVALQVYLGNGDTTFGAANSISIDASENIPYNLIAEDLDGDGNLDLASTNAGSSSVSIRTGIGNGQFNPITSVSLLGGASPSGLAIGDFDKDNIKDLVVLNSGLNSMTMLMGQVAGAISFNSSQVYGTGGSPLSVVVRDFNKDNYDDLGILNASDSTISININDQSAQFNELVTLPIGSGGTSLLSIDLNGDNNWDLATTNNTDNNISIFTGRGDGLFDTISPIDVTLNPTFITAGLMNSDARPDLVLVGQGEQKLQLLAGQANNIFGYTTLAFVNPIDAEFADFNFDGSLDMAVLSAGSKSVDIFYGNNEGLFTNSGISLNTNDNSSRIVLADFRNADRKDIVSVNTSKSNIRIFFDNGNATYAAPIELTVGNSPIDAVIEDFNNDSYQDIAVVNSGSNTISVFLGQGNGSFSAKQDFNTGGSPWSIKAADVNNNGTTDLVVVNKTSDSFGVFLGNGDGTFQTQADYYTGGSPVALQLADVNGDAKIDVLTTNASDATVGVTRGNGDGSFQTPNFYSAGITPDRMTTGDFNGDGQLDIGVVNGANNSYTLLVGNSSGQFNTSYEFDTGHNTISIKAADLNSDRSLDLVIFDNTINAFKIWVGH